jgi:hypothetical protein
MFSAVVLLEKGVGAGSAFLAVRLRAVCMVRSTHLYFQAARSFRGSAGEHGCAGARVTRPLDCATTGRSVL